MALALTCNRPLQPIDVIRLVHFLLLLIGDIVHGNKPTADNDNDRRVVKRTGFEDV